MRFFERELTEIVKRETNISDARFVLHAEAPAIDGQESETSEPTILVSIRLFPSDDQSEPNPADLVKSMFENPNLVNALKAMQDQINNLDAGLCYNKKCPVGFICINGQCLSRVMGEQVDVSLIPEFAPMALRSESAQITSGNPNAKTGQIQLEVVIPIAIAGTIILTIIGILIWHLVNRSRRSAAAVMAPDTAETTPLTRTSV